MAPGYFISLHNLQMDASIKMLCRLAIACEPDTTLSSNHSKLKTGKWKMKDQSHY